jgi:hypothetical protein
MKNVVKQVLMLAVLLVATPVLAGEGPTKGTKSYQSSARAEKPAQPEQTADAAPVTANDVSQIAPAAGDTAESQDQPSEGKTMREEMKLPRKN